MKKISSALIGCGRIGFILEEDKLRKKPCTHFGGASSAGIKITSACDIDKERLAMFRDKSGIPGTSCYTDYKELLQKEHPHLVIITTWTESHAPIAIASIKSGAKVVVLEKPVAGSLKLARQISDTAAEYGCSVIVNHERRFDSRYIKVRDMLQKNEIGRVLTVNARILTGGYRGKSLPGEGGGPLLHDGTHLVDILRFFFGDFKTVRGEFSRFTGDSGYEDYAAAWLKTDSGINIFLEAGGGRKYFLFEVEIWGTDGKIIIGNGYNRIYKNVSSRYYTGFRDLNEAEFPGFRENNCFTGLYKDVKKALQGKNFSNNSTIDDGYRALELVHAVYLSAYKSGEEINLPINKNSVNLQKIFNLNQI
ncbi:MAG TPA: Gfo/Idh/MocA family oxidoreductase [Spirochaetota bacterium]|nr:Gfo/Idh/MocA family oxidoreductase [Spirochaetota bacterium]HPJ41926.1 Gfo/Idh/MocA family oxidoreductase [Spirochaetota bacterium]HPR38052.1 Gfo/Idh/MocA family oxidoreductase [Spirochaetota bacterium]HRX48359.1 Gfo/Idh/MocA family oxidoreductase [Spirochaetota bacterium]